MLVTGIQPSRVCAVNEALEGKGCPAPKDLGALHPCDEHRDEEIGVSVAPIFMPTRRIVTVFGLATVRRW
ncbi:hypothetical protein CO654_28755 [Rhizobium sp. L18]|nr:hypothetical protein CO654_28755 [Rhizobium sp. L18]